MSDFYYFIGIGGIGMSGLALILLGRGEKVAGSDPQVNAETRKLEQCGATIYTSQVAENLSKQPIKLVVVTAAIHDDNPELIAAKQLGLSIVSRAEFLGQLMSTAKGPRIAISGTHGKTTTTAMVTQVLMDSGLDPTSLIGGAYAPIGGNVRQGGDVFVTEACEAYDSFLSFTPDIVVITNCEADHLDHFHDETGVFEAFRKFIMGMSSAGTLIYNSDDIGIQELLKQIPVGFPATRIACGLNQNTGVRDTELVATDIANHPDNSEYTVSLTKGGTPVLHDNIKVHAPGNHNVSNSLLAVAVGLTLGASTDGIKQGLWNFAGTGRRFELLGTVNGVPVIDDYAHHPSEIRATLSAIRLAYPDKRVVAVFQPHLYSRTRDFMEEFAISLSQADVAILTDIYPARELPIPGVKVADIVRKIAEHSPKISVLYIPLKSDVQGALEFVIHANDVVLIMGAGDIRQVGEEYVLRGNK